MAKRIVPVVVILLLVGFFGWRAWQQRLAAQAADRFNGTVEATEVLLSPQLSGQIVEKNVLEGQRVKKGDLLGKVVSLVGDTLQRLEASCDGVVSSTRTSVTVNAGDVLAQIARV